MNFTNSIYDINQPLGIGWEVWIPIIIGLICSVIALIWACANWKGKLDQWKDQMDTWKTKLMKISKH
jgi:hypothetical protein